MTDIGRQQVKKRAATEDGWSGRQRMIVGGRGIHRCWNKIRRAINKRALRRELNDE